jgi:hypothetical protein
VVEPSDLFKIGDLRLFLSDTPKLCPPVPCRLVESRFYVERNIAFWRYEDLRTGKLSSFQSCKLFSLRKLTESEALAWAAK